MDNCGRLHEWFNENETYERMKEFEVSKLPIILDHWAGGRHSGYCLGKLVLDQCVDRVTRYTSNLSGSQTKGSLEVDDLLSLASFLAPLVDFASATDDQSISSSKEAATILCLVLLLPHDIFGSQLVADWSAKVSLQPVKRAAALRRTPAVVTHIGHSSSSATSSSATYSSSSSSPPPPPLLYSILHTSPFPIFIADRRGILCNSVVCKLQIYSVMDSTGAFVISHLRLNFFAVRIGFPSLWMSHRINEWMNAIRRV